MRLRPYQQTAVDKTIERMRKTTAPLCLELATGAGKSLVVAALAKWLFEKSGKKILCLAPSKELVEQNFSKYPSLASIYCASVRKELRHPVIFCSPLTTKNGLDYVLEYPIAGIIIDEAHGLTPTVKHIIEAVQEKNPNARIIGLSATPYRMGTGYIYAKHNGRLLTEEEAIKPFFSELVYRVTAPQLIEQNYLTPPSLPETIEHYNAASLELNRSGNFDSKEVEKVFEGQGRLTYNIVQDIVSKSQGRRGVIIFAATIKHANEILESLPIAKLITGETPKKEREHILKSFAKQEFKFLLNVACLTTGFDAPHVDVIAILRATESPALFQQIIGRGTRLYDSKTDFLILDYAENIERHELQNNLFEPVIKTKKKGKGETIPVECPECHYVNNFTAKPNPDNYPIVDGYFTDLLGVKLEPAHFGRSCQAVYETGKCEHLFVAKLCPQCDHDVDISARFCPKCYAELINPNDKLTINHASVHAKIVPVTSYIEQDHVSKQGNQCKKVTFNLANNETAIKFYSPNSVHPFPRQEYFRFKKMKQIMAIKLIQEGEKWQVKELLANI